ncbi:MAG: hypothetical protein WAV20_11075, partial [Blastocatellia bacterium]
MSELWPWLALLGLGAFHGINPAMGWLFAVALGLQEKSRRAVLAALPPIALGHALSIALVVGLLWLAQASVPEKALRYGASGILFGFGLFRLVRSRHPRWVGMRVGFRDLTLWSFLMASAHGAGLMLIPILLRRSQPDHAGHAGHMSLAGYNSSNQITALAGPLEWIAAVVVHSTGHLLGAALSALLVYEKLGVALLRRGWINLDLVGMIALM